MLQKNSNLQRGNEVRYDDESNQEHYLWVPSSEKGQQEIGRSLNNSRRKLEVLHIEWLVEFAKAHQLNGFTRSDVRACLLRSFPQLATFSIETWDWALRSWAARTLRKWDQRARATSSNDWSCWSVYSIINTISFS